jgi:curli biogenesis system outer membrane secretion channel CsgG
LRSINDAASIIEHIKQKGIYMKKIASLLAASSLLLLVGCATESHKAVQVEKSVSAQTAYNYQGPKYPIMVSNFDNKSGFMRGVFSEGPDRLSSQAKTVLMAHLQQTGRFSVLDRDNMKELSAEAKISGKKQKLKGANFAITGDVAEFGRKETGDRQLFGVLGSGKSQVAYSKVTLNVVDVGTSEVVYSASGSGEYELNNREVLGFGGTAAYDSTLNGKVLDLAMREAVDRIVEGLEKKQWTLSK